ncbi:TetR/AcrR family transcriptional regulator [Nocardia miyunensis]|uniref:TetR/AcrR family transcriptional regulator n=1 Tax=Nocardia miyunensis TaxID=282684 RepID=UPI000A48218A|nr:TetR/AcrR family transcriptional regulator [Nocardia miyunensis]
MSVQPDPRVARTNHALRQAVVELASQRPISQVTVAELAARAGTTRATFYKRFISPQELLIEVLCADLDRGHRLEDENRSTGRYSGPELTRMGVDEVAEHVLRFEAVYRHVLEDRADHVVHQALVRHFADYTLRQLLDLDLAGLPPANRHLMAQFLAHGFAGAITSWLSDETLTKQELVDAAIACAPAWWS